MRGTRAAGALLGATLLLVASAALAESLSGKVVGVTDGDTITVLVGQSPVKVRLAEIDTPENGQPWGTRAKQALSDKVFGEVVEVRVVDTDRYGRTVGRVYRGGRDINREMVREGHAWAVLQSTDATRRFVELRCPISRPCVEELGDLAGHRVV
jgi:endonuclease YncB( thermonuclease family)